MYLHKLRSVALMANLSLTDCSGRRARRMRTQIARAPAIAATRSSSSYRTVLHLARTCERRQISSDGGRRSCDVPRERSEEHTSELRSLMRISYAVFCLKEK